MQYKWVALSVTSLGILMSGLDARIVVVGLPTIAQQLHADAEQVIWVNQAYLFASTVALLIVGRLTDITGRVKIYNVGFIVFTIGSALSAISFTPLELILSRLVQGTGSAMLVTNSQAIIADAAPPGELGTLTGLNQVAFRIGGVMGLTLAGVIISIADWRALFYVNIPIGIFGTLWAYLKLREISVQDEAKKMDWAGLTTFTAGLALILFAITFLSYGTGVDTIASEFMAVVGLAMIVIFVLIEMKVKIPALDLNLFKIREFAGSTLAQMLNALSLFGIQVVISFYLQIGLGYSPLAAGLGLLPLEVTYAIFGVSTARLSDKYGVRVFTTTGLAISSCGVIALTTFSLNTTFNEVAIVLAIIGIGNGLFVSPNLSSLLGSVPAKRRGVASGFRITLFNVAVTMSSGLAVLIITLGIPSQLFNLLLEGQTAGIAIQLARAQFITGFRLSCIMLAIANASAIIPSALRGPRVLQTSKKALSNESL